MAIIDLSLSPPPAVVETLDYEALVAQRKANLIASYPAAEQDEIGATLALESEPLTKQIEFAAELEMKLRARVNEAAVAVLLPFAVGADLDDIAARYNVSRLTIQPAAPDTHPPTEAIYETDTDLRNRVLLSLEGLSVAGPAGAYEFHARSASGGVLDAKATAPRFSVTGRDVNDNIILSVVDDAGLDDPMPGNVVVSVLARAGDGTADQALLDTVDAALSAEDVRPLADSPVIRSADIVNYNIEATLYFYDGPDRAVVLTNAQSAAEAYAVANHRLGHDITLSGIYAALHQPGVQRAELLSPAATIVISPRQAAYCTGITLTDGGVDE